MRSLVLLVVLAAVVASLSLAAAQAPSAAPGVDVTADRAEGTVTVERATVLTFHVKNTTPATGTPLDDQNKGDVVLRISGLPAGWTASAPQVAPIKPGDTANVDIQVSVATSHTGKETTLTLTADLYSPLRGLDPILTNVPGASQKATDAATMHLKVDNSTTRDVIEAIGPWIYAILVLLLVAVLVAVALAVAGRRSLVRLSCDTRERPVAPGGRVAFPFLAEGLARDRDTVIFAVSAVPEGWSAFLPVPDVVLDAGQVLSVDLVVVAPPSAAQGTRQAILVTATSAKAPKGAANLELVAVVDGPEVLPESPRRRKA